MRFVVRNGVAAVALALFLAVASAAAADPGGGAFVVHDLTVITQQEEITDPCTGETFTSSFGRAFGLSPTAYRARHPPAAARVSIPTCVLQAYARPQSSTFGEDSRELRG